jgi:pyrroloquinoline quinone biosynthesis protein B
LVSADGKESGLWLEPLSVPGKLPIHLEGRAQASAADNVGLLIHEPARAKSLAYFPAAAGPTPELRAALAGTDCIFFDGTFWSSDELPALGLGEKRAEDMAHWPIGGTSGSLAFLAAFAHKRRILIHINNTNPLLMEDAPQRAALRAVGVELAYDGMELTL